MAKSLVLKFINFYQYYISPFLRVYLNVNCRYYPSCSEYAKEVIRSYGVFRGSLLAIKRIIRCNPFSPGGYDPPPVVETLRRRSEDG